MAAKKVVVRRRPVVEPEPQPVYEGHITATIPDASVGERYIPRRVNGVWDLELLQYAQENGINVLLQGDTGAGKTAVGEAYASQKECLYYSLPCDVSIDPSAMMGKLMPTDDGGFEWVDGPVTSIVRGPCGLGSACDDPDCYAGVLNISEMNFMPPKIAAALYSLLDSRRTVVLLGNKGEVIEAHHNLLIIGDMNPNYRGTVQLNAAFFNRFAIKVKWGYDDGVERKLVKSASLRALASKLRAKYGTELRTPVSTNMLMEFERFMIEPLLGLSFAVENFCTTFQPDEEGAVRNVIQVMEADLKADAVKLTDPPEKGKKPRVEEDPEEQVMEDEATEYEMEF